MMVLFWTESTAQQTGILANTLEQLIRLRRNNGRF
jgi:hypothetical protein